MPSCFITETKAAAPTVQEAEWAPVPDWMGILKEDFLSPLGFEPWNIQPLASQTNDVLFGKSDSLGRINNGHECDSSN